MLLYWSNITGEGGKWRMKKPFLNLNYEEENWAWWYVLYMSEYVSIVVWYGRIWWLSSLCVCEPFQAISWFRVA